MKKIFSFFLQMLLLGAVALSGVSCERIIFEDEGYCPPEEIEPEPGIFRISVRTVPAGAGTASVQGPSDEAGTEGEFYVSILVQENESYTLTAAENPGYEFFGWHDDTHETFLGKEQVIDLTATEPARYTAVFTKIEEEPEEPEPEPGIFRISVKTVPSGAGTALVQGRPSDKAETEVDLYVSIFVQEDETYTLTATENDGYEFVGWHDDTNETFLGGSEKPVIDRTATEPAKYTALFIKKAEVPEEPAPEPEPEPGDIRISVRTNIDLAGTAKVASGAKANDTDATQYVSIVIKENESYTLTATENDGYVFVGWHDDSNDSYLGDEKDKVIGDVRSETSTRYTAIYAKLADPAEPVKISVRTNIDKAGIARVDAEEGTNMAETVRSYYVSIVLEENETYTLTAAENDGYVFVGWHDDTNDCYLGGADGKFEEGKFKVIENIRAEASARYTAVFDKADVPVEPEPEPEPGEIRISVRTSIDFAGTAKVASGAKANDTDATQYVSIVIKENESYTLTATENPGYEFVRWHDDTNETNLPDGKAVIENIESPVSTQYTALYKVKADEPEPEPEPETKYYVEYVYDMNMKFADAFYSQVESVELYVFDTAGKFVKKYEVSNKNDNNILKNRNYRMDVSDLAPGDYEFIAWCGLVGNTNFKLPDVIEKNTDAYCTLQYGGGVSDDNLKPVFHGRIGKVTLEEHPAGSEQTVTVSLTKDTNNINLSLTQLGNAGMEPGQFAVRMSGGLLAQMDYTNKPMGSSVEYTPWGDYPKYGFVDINGQTADRYNYMRAELSTSRLMANGDPTIEIVDTHNNNKVVFSIPFVDWVNAFRSANHTAMGAQEYLDREDEYNLMLYLENNKEGWIAVSVVINGWRVEDNGEVDL